MGNIVSEAAEGVVTVITDTTGKVENIAVTGIHTTGIFAIDTQRNIVQSYMDTQANVLATLNNAGLEVYNAYQSTQKNAFSTVRDTETRFFSVVDSVLDRETDLLMAIIDGLGYLIILWLMLMGGFWMLFHKDIFELLKSALGKIPL